MPLLRLKNFSNEIYLKYLALADEPTPDEKKTAIAKKLRISYAVTAQTVLFFNQAQPNMPLDQWVEKVPSSYFFEIDHFLSLLEDSIRWAVSAIGMPACSTEESELEAKLLSDIDNFKVYENDEQKDQITVQFQRTCLLVHSEVPNNLRKRKALLRLIWAYLCAKDLTIMGRDLSSCDRVDYLKKLTNY